MSEVFKLARDLFGRGEPEAKVAPVKKPVHPWHAVRIAPGPRSCDTARAIMNRRFLSREAPPLPLKNCSSATCTCHYEHFDDRRNGPRRAKEMGVSIDGHDGAEQRGEMKRGRRKTDT